MKKLMLCVAVLAMLSACETMQGLGRDMQKGGNNLEDLARSTTP